MLDFIASQFKLGDYITIHCGNKSFTGAISFLNQSMIALKQSDGRLCGIKGEDISFFEQASSSDASVVDNPDKVLSSGNESSSVLEGQKSTSPKSDKHIAESKESDESLSSVDSPSEKPSGDSSKVIPSDSSSMGFTIVGKIPLEELQRIDPKKFGKPNKKSTSHSPEQTVSTSETKTDTIVPAKTNSIVSSGKKTLGSFSELGFLVEKEHEIQNQQVVPATGEIVYLNVERNFGFIKNKYDHAQVYFSIGQVIDKDLKSKLAPNISVVYTQVTFDQGPQAQSIHRPMRVSELLSLARSLDADGNSRQAVEVLDHVLTEYPDNFDADALKKTISAKIVVRDSPYKGNPFIYAKAKEYHSNKEYDKAIEYYIKAISKGIKVPSAVKDVAGLYVQLYKESEDTITQDNIRETALQFLDENVKKLPDNLSTWNFLEGVYYALMDFDNFHSVVDRMLDVPEIRRDSKRKLILLGKKAAAFVRQERFDDAMDIIEECLDEDPENSTALKLKLYIEEGQGDAGDIESIFTTTVFDYFTSGVSGFIQDTLEQYNDYIGVPAKVIEAGNFTNETLKGIRSLIDRVGRARARERAKYLLTEGKLMLELEPDNMVKLRSEMARYCTAMAFNHISDYTEMDVTRFYYQEAFSLEEKYHNMATHVSSYLLTHCYTCAELMKANNQGVSVDSALTLILSGDFDTKRWDSILSMLLYNREISAQITSKLFSNASWRALSVKALGYFGVKNVNETNQDSFVNAWNTARDIRIRDLKQSIAQIKSLVTGSNIEEAVLSLQNLNSCKRDWFTSLDIRRINSIILNIVPAIEQYIKSTGYRNKESNYNNSQGQIQQLIDEITFGPTKLSYDAILPLLKRVQGLLTSSFNDVIKASEPKITISLLSSETVVSDNNVVQIQVSVANHKDSSPIREVSVSVDPTDDISLLPSENVSYNALEGGESLIFKIRLKVGQTIIQQKATAINTICKFKSGDSYKEEKALLSLRLYSPDDYVIIDNPYAPIADGGPVPVGSSMFYGREAFIANIVDAITKSPSKQIIIYGQKRCGKSSVMLHLKKQLQETGKTFCVFFSLGDIIQNLTEAAFYHKILSSIKDELDNLEFDGVKVPAFDVPKMADFKAEDEDNPLNTFTSYMIKFKRACKSTEGWEEKNLVVMIDEFTSLYTEIKEEHISPSIMKQWKAVTQNERAQFSVVLVGQDVVPSFKKEDYARNAFGVIQDIRLTYLAEQPARDLIEKPILDETGKSRYIGNAVSRIIDYTSRNPYYIQIFCARLVDYMNDNKSITVTEADVNDVARSFIVGDQALEEDKFDNLIRAGETEDLQEYPESAIRAVLKGIAVASKNIGFCNRSDLNVLEDKQLEDQILKHLVDREVLEKRGEETYKIQVKLFQEWLLNH